MDQLNQVIDIEEFAKAGKVPPQGPQYRIRVDKTQFTVNAGGMTGKQILELAGKIPSDRFKLYQHMHGGTTERIGHDVFVDFTTPGIERFKTMPVDSTDGLANPRRQFRLPESDEAFLDRLALPWEAVAEGDAKWLLIAGYKIPPGYTSGTVALAVLVSPDYPISQLDMAWFFPALARINGRCINGVSSQNFDGKQFQRWSRHRTSANPWRPGIDDLETHLLLIDHWLENELTR